MCGIKLKLRGLARSVSQDIIVSSVQIARVRSKFINVMHICEICEIQDGGQVNRRVITMQVRSYLLFQSTPCFSSVVNAVTSQVVSFRTSRRSLYKETFNPHELPKPEG